MSSIQSIGKIVMSMGSFLLTYSESHIIQKATCAVYLYMFSQSACETHFWEQHDLPNDRHFGK
eukprot:3400655-Amphidinium_carterae.1